MLTKRNLLKLSGIFFFAVTIAGTMAFLYSIYSRNTPEDMNYYYLIGDFNAHKYFTFEENSVRDVYPVLYVFIYFFDIYLPIEHAIASAVLLFNTVAGILIYRFSRKEGLGFFASSFAAVALILVSSIYNIDSRTFYLGTFSPNVIHNPTYTVMKPFAIYVLIVFFRILAKGKKSIGSFGDNTELRQWTQLSLALALCNLAKPNFFIVFAPAALLFALYYLFRNRFSVRESGILFGKGIVALTLPTLVFLYQYYLMFNKNGGYTGQAGIEFAPFEVWSQLNKGHSVLFAILCMTAFPLVYTLLNVQKLKGDSRLVFVWIMELTAIFQLSMLAEKGVSRYHGNLVWGYSIASLLLIIYCAILLLKDLKNIPVQSKQRLRTIIPAVCLLFFLLHLVSGVFYNIEAYRALVLRAIMC